MLLALAAVLTATVVAAEPTRTGASSHGAVAGTVTLTDASRKTFDAPGVRLTLTCAATPEAPQVATSDDHGTFRFVDVRPDRCSIDTDLQGFAKATALAVVRAGDTAHVAIHLEIAPVGTGIRVVGKSVRSWRTETAQPIMGRILTGEEFHDRFSANPADMLSSLSGVGYDLTRGGIEALAAIDRRWEVGPDWIDARLQRRTVGLRASIARGNRSRS